MARVARTVLVVSLLAGTAGAFAVTERLKLVRSPIFDTRLVHKVFAPTCGCPSERVRIGFRLRREDEVTVAVVADGGEVVRTLAADELAGPGPFAVEWDGRDGAGRLVPEGVYRPRVHLDGARQTILLPNPIRVDLTPPRVLAARVEPRVFSPDGDGINDRVRIAYELSERGRALVFLGSRRVVRSRSQRPAGKVEWYGRVEGRPLRRGRYLLAVAAEDVAGNVGPRVEREVRIRYVELARSVVRVRAGRRFGVRVISDARVVRWRFAGGRGRAAPGLLVLRAPTRPGRYTLYVQANGRADRARVVVGR